MKDQKKEHILLLSYFSDKKGCCPAEWLDDKVISLTELGYKVSLISSYHSNKKEVNDVQHFRVPSLTYTDIKEELKDRKQNGLKTPLSFWLWTPLILLIGFPLDFIMRFFLGGVGGGKLSWVISSFLASCYVLLRHRTKLIFSTGGPAASHLTALLSGKLFRKKIVIELQDPLAGEGIGRNSASATLLRKLEKLLVMYSNKVVYVTKKASDEAKKRYLSNKISYIYPGSRKFSLPSHNEMKKGRKFKMLHLGTLYSSRNFDTLLKAIDKLINENQLKEEEIELINLGDIYGNYKEYYLSRSFVKQYPVLPRSEALAFASQADLNIIIQHNDPRSELTIPYKTYDYLNLRRKILGLTKNNELNRLLEEKGHATANIDDIDEIARVLISIIRDGSLYENDYLSFDITEQTEKLLEL